MFASQVQTSWPMIYTTLRNKFGSEHYHRGQTLTKVNQSASGTVQAIFSSGLHAEASLLLGADGFESTVRRLLWPEREPTYAGYVTWHGVIPENDIPKEVRKDLIENFCMATNQSSHFLGYLIPGEGNDLRRGRRLYSWAWYRPAPLDLLEASCEIPMESAEATLSLLDGSLTFGKTTFGDAPICCFHPSSVQLSMQPVNPMYKLFVTCGLIA